MKFSLESQIDRIVPVLASLGRQIPFALSLAVNRTAQGVKQEIRQEMERVFDRPTPYTLNALQLTPATKSNLTAKVWFKRTRTDHYLTTQAFGGLRKAKAFESALNARGVLRGGQFAVPPDGGSFMTRMDAYGNISPGQIRQILSMYGAAESIDGYMTVGFTANMTEKTRARFKKRHGAMFMSVGPDKYYTVQRKDGTYEQRRQHLPAGIWMRTTGKGLHIFGPLLMFVSQPHYTPRFDFYGVGQRTFERDGTKNLAEAVKQAIATAR